MLVKAYNFVKIISAALEFVHLDMTKLTGELSQSGPNKITVVKNIVS